ncbi:oxidoreductase [Volvox carteri f. nagariensis]|uniref:FAD-dependent oxidoreductase domain-containing protein 1 n=1 Tax=Volvox carteri f. nagariensis TaxID=3068 RepID=D8TZA3_VOLCA|nr:oxidoreductase [Volvox carteri f. nagariensis]EFJ47144.1 oxidoreductase [Volvox carteri f. nagariensis]|eukprot:XP_002951693.1 oxidoreductase [Volvox carteri f. nagariensis]
MSWPLTWSLWEQVRATPQHRRQPLGPAFPGIVGLFAAQELLRNQLSVLLLERKGLCAGATGAGQGYLWMAHRAPGSVGWALAARSLALWRRRVQADEGLREAIEWQDCGSLLVSTGPGENTALSERQLALNAVGLKASYLDPRRLAQIEPGLVPPGGGGGLLVQSDLQINGRAAAHTLLQRCRADPGFGDLMGPEGEVLGLELSAGPSGGHVVKTSGRRIHARHALVLSAGVWTGGLLSAATGDPVWAQLLQPRRGHLLEMPRPAAMPPVTHGMMEMSYTKHYATASAPKAAAPAASSPSSSASSSSSASPREPADITFTATTGASGSLLIGSSRESGEWDTSPSPAIIAAILQRSALFLPGLKDAAAAATAAAAAVADGKPDDSAGGGALAGLSVRVGLRPYALGGLPLIGPVEGAPGLFVAAGHEGSGLCMAPGTGELLVRHIRTYMGVSGLDTASFQDLRPDVRRRAVPSMTVKA